MLTTLILASLTASGHDFRVPLLSPVFGDHMVLQRDKPNTFWGWAVPGTTVKVAIEGHTATGTADAQGKWMAKITPPPTGGPYRVTIDGPQHLQLEDVMVGDVWICSGQSNMEMGIGLIGNPAEEIAAANYPNIRLYNVPKTTATTPLGVNAASWVQCTPASVSTGGWGGFSAAAYFFGRELNRRLNVPIGLVETCWGGTIAEAWTSKKGLDPFPEFHPGIAALEASSAGQVPITSQYDDWLAKNDPGMKAGWQNGEPGAPKWMPVQVPTSYEALGRDKFDGVLWFSRQVDVPDPKADASITLGEIDDMDTVWINGTQVGASYAWDVKRDYKIPAGTLHAGKNTIVVRVFDGQGPGGFRSARDAFAIKFGDGTSIPIAGEWGFREGINLATAPPLPIDSTNPNIPTALYNGMIAPLLPMAIKGAIWYQGESNADRAYQYRKLLPAMISDWRRLWGQGNFPFFIVQLANFGQRAPEAGDDAWAELREAQTMTANKVPNTGLALAIDIGDAADIHPKNKQEVGRRLALAALKIAYRQNVAFSGPTYRSMKREGNAIRVAFDHVEGRLNAKDGILQGFSIAGADQKFHWATAQIDGDTVIVSSPDVPDPVAVRYAWASNPAATLYNNANLPAVPFRTDAWKGITMGRK